MSDDELEYLRSILTRSHNRPKRTGILEIVGRAVRRLFTRPKKAAAKQVGKDRRKKDAA